MPLSVFARNNDERTVKITDRVQIGNVQLMPGTYRVEWPNAGPNVQVSFVRHGATVVTISGTLRTNDPQVIQNDIITEKAGSKTLLREIDFIHGKEAIKFSRGA